MLESSFKRRTLNLLRENRVAYTLALRVINSLLSLSVKGLVALTREGAQQPTNNFVTKKPPRLGGCMLFTRLPT